MIHQNSRDVYHNIVLPNIKAGHKKVVDALKILGEATSLEVADYINKPLHSISGRFTELSTAKEYGKPIIESVGSRLNRYGNPCTIWRLKIYQKQGEQQGLFQ